jgi:chromosomal replication initiator protein
VAQPHSSASGWDAFHQSLRDRVTPGAWKTWLEPLDPELEGATLRLVAPTDFHYRWVSDRYLGDIQEATLEAFGVDIVVDLTVDAFVRIDEPAPLPTHDPSGGSRSVAVGHEPRLVPKYTFDNFVVGQSNRFAHAAALAVAEQPGSHYNPLFIYADAGLGKTHLLHAVGQHRRELDPGAVVRYVSSEQFFNEFINGIRQKRMDQFKARYRTIDVLLLDDVQFFEGKEQILEEFFHTFNSLYEAGRQLVISSDRHPKHLSTLEDRLRSRFEWGLLTDIQTPDVETRLAILRKNADFAPMPVPTDVLLFIAEHVSDNVRELEGALTRVTAFAALTGERITAEMAREVLRDVVGANDATPITSDMIIDITSLYFGITVDDLTGPSRRQPLARSRQISMYLCREHTDLSLPKIGSAFGGRDHTTVLHAVDRVKNLMQEDKQVFDEVTKLSQKLRKT